MRLDRDALVLEQRKAVTTMCNTILERSDYPESVRSRGLPPLTLAALRVNAGLFGSFPDGHPLNHFAFATVHKR